MNKKTTFNNATNSFWPSLPFGKGTSRRGDGVSRPMPSYQASMWHWSLLHKDTFSIQIFNVLEISSFKNYTIHILLIYLKSQYWMS